MTTKYTINSVNVWDPFVRLFHWSLVAGVFVAGVTGFLVGGRAIDIHIWAGTVVFALVALRLVWGVLGPSPARFSRFVKGPRATLEHLHQRRRHLGHNPLGGWMVVALIAVIAGLGVTGAVALGGIFHVGPVKAAATVGNGFLVVEVHELLAILLVGLVIAHLGGVLFESRRSQENLARAMVTGRKDLRLKDEPLPVARAHPVLAGVIGVVGMLGAGVLLASMSNETVPNAPVDIADSAYAAQCADCHMAYHPSLLPAGTWRAIMATLDDHFGEDAGLPSAVVDEVTAFLVANAAEVADTKPAKLFARISAEDPLAITESPIWKRIHHELPDGIFQQAPIFAESNCAACHQDATSGWFYPGNIAVPRPATKAP